MIYHAPSYKNFLSIIYFPYTCMKQNFSRWKDECIINHKSLRHVTSNIIESTQLKNQTNN